MILRRERGGHLHTATDDPEEGEGGDLFYAIIIQLQDILLGCYLKTLYST